MIDLRSFLTEHPGAVHRLPGALDVVHEITALQHELSARRLYPVLIAERALLDSGAPSAMPVVTNLMASRTLLAAALGLDDGERLAPTLAARARSRLAPELVDREAAPVQQVVRRGEEVDLAALPMLRRLVGGDRPVLGAAHCVTIDPETGAPSSTVHPSTVHGARRLALHPDPHTPARRDLHRWWARGEACPVALWIGHHPAVEMGARAWQAGLVRDWDTAGGVAGRAIRLAASVTHGDAVLVPADAEIVIEGWCPPDTFVDGGPAPALGVTCITHRGDALYHDVAVGLEGHLVPAALAMEGMLYARVKPVAPSLIDVHVPFAARLTQAVFQFLDPGPGEARDALATALGVRGLRSAIALDEDIDMLDEGEILWALATRMQWHRDVIRVDGLTRPDPDADPSAAAPVQTVSRLGIDATLPPATRPGAPKPFTPRISVPEAAAARAEQVLAGIDLEGFPAR